MAEKHTVHHYHAVCNWSGSTAGGYHAYDRSHELRAPPFAEPLPMSADPAFHGNPERLNPEQLLVMAAASCQMLTFLAIAARAHLDVVAYEDRAEGFMPEHDQPMRITRIVLRPKITVRGTLDQKRLQPMLETAHRHCFIASSLKSQIEIIPEFLYRA